jgi:hypothetical protein
LQVASQVSLAHVSCGPAGWAGRLQVLQLIVCRQEQVAWRGAVCFRSWVRGLRRLLSLDSSGLLHSCEWCSGQFALWLCGNPVWYTPTAACAVMLACMLGSLCMLAMLCHMVLFACGLGQRWAGALQARLVLAGRSIPCMRCSPCAAQPVRWWCVWGPRFLAHA